MATDIVDKELGALRKKRWETAFSTNCTTSTPDSEQDDVNRKATIVIEHLIQVWGWRCCLYRSFGCCVLFRGWCVSFAVAHKLRSLTINLPRRRMFPILCSTGKLPISSSPSSPLHHFPTECRNLNTLSLLNVEIVVPLFVRHVYCKWNKKFFNECYKAYLDGRADKGKQKIDRVTWLRSVARSPFFLITKIFLSHIFLTMPCFRLLFGFNRSINWLVSRRIRILWFLYYPLGKEIKRMWLLWCVIWWISKLCHGQS